MPLTAKAMLSSARIADICGVKRPFFTLSSRLSSFKLNFSTFSAAEVSCCLDEDCDDFLPWLERKAGVEISSLLSIGKSAYGRSLCASKPIEVGDCMLRVPIHAQISPGDLLPEINGLLSDEVGDVAKLAIIVLVEQKIGLQSEWAPYISRLPQPEDMHNTIFWSEMELEMIRPSILVQQTIRKNSFIGNEFLAAKPALDRYTGTFEQVTIDDFRHAYALVESRAWRSAKGVSLIPFADFLNHDGRSETMVLYDEDKGLSEVIADHNYAHGDQVLIRYGNFSNATLLLEFGFTLPQNIYDEVEVEVNIPHLDPLHARKMELLQHCTPTMKHVNRFGSTWDSFTIREVRSARGKGRGIPQSLRAFSRVLCCTSSQELDDLEMEAAQNDGRLARSPFRNKSREKQAHQYLLSLITMLIAEYNSSLNLLWFSNSSLTPERFALRKKMAQDLLIGELRILKSASEWLKNYCESLSDS